MAYRPITDVWIMARPKVSYYGAYPAGFVERARALLGVTINDALLHVCGGKVRDYPYLKRAVGPRDGTIDLDPECSPDFLMDVRALGSSPGDLFPWPDSDGLVAEVRQDQHPGVLWDAALVDRPYSEADAAHYAPGSDVLPEPNDLLKRALSVVRPGGRVGFLDYYIPRPPKKVGDTEIKFVACVGVMCGFGNRMRAFTVFERVADNALLSARKAAGAAAEDDAGDESPEADEPLVEPTPAQQEIVSRVASAVVSREKLCRVCWGERRYPLPGPDQVPLPEAKCDGCGERATLMPAPLTVPVEPEPAEPMADDPLLDGF